ncbi:MAG TPA: Gfo/Idh/MocA family oxidoreductase [Verrucomicrobiae bacterium]|jgi:predicted dehydrogenase
MSLRLGLIGAGRWGKRYIQTLNSVSEARLTCLSTRHQENAALSLHPLEVVPDWRALCQPGKVDGVIIATPPATHAEILRACLKARLPAMVEKPLCLSLPEALQLQAQASRVPVLVDHTQLFQPAYEEIYARSRPPGSIRFIRSEGESFGPFRSDTSALWDWAPHDVSLCLDLMGALPQSVACFGGLAGPAGPGVLSLRLAFAAGVEAWANIGPHSTQKRRRLSVFGPNHVLVFDDLAPDKLSQRRLDWDARYSGPEQLEQAGQAIPIANDLPLTRAVREFVLGLQGKPSRHFGLDLAVNVIRVLAAAEEALRVPASIPVPPH